jgi:hypothetical protein
MWGPLPASRQRDTAVYAHGTVGVISDGRDVGIKFAD